MGKINLRNISEPDVREWNEEIRAYNELSNNEDELRMIDPLLMYELETVSGYLLKGAIDQEKEITQLVTSIINDDSCFVELDNRLKGKKRIKEKIYHRAKKYSMGILEASKTINDVIRYTIIIDYDNYTNRVDEYLRILEEMGFSIIVFKNRWEEVYCKGISVQFETSEHTRFEIQFHTRESYMAKEDNNSRELYKLSRNEHAPLELLLKANVLRKLYQENIHIPRNASNYKYVSQNKKEK